jgi:hypothetical protein
VSDGHAQAVSIVVADAQIEVLHLSPPPIPWV